LSEAEQQRGREVTQPFDGSVPSPHDPREGLAPIETTPLARALPRSALGTALDGLQARARGQVRIPEYASAVWDLVLGMCVVLSDTEDQRPWQARLDDLEVWLTDLPPGTWDSLTAELNQFAETNQLPDWLTRWQRVDFLSFVERAVGAAAYHRLRRAALSDLTVVGDAVRHAIKVLQPYAVAMQDLLLAMDDQQKAQLKFALGPAEALLLSMILQLDAAVLRFLDAAVRDEFTRDLFKDVPAPSPDEVEALLPALRGVLSDQARQIADELGSTVSRKIRGARDAITLSADPVSQAANSLIELIDRLLRSAFSDDEVLTWVDTYRPVDRAMTYLTDRGDRRPTKRAQALCFVCAGVAPQEQPGFAEMLAAVIVSARTSLQRLKHADSGDPEELTQLGALMNAVESFFALGVRLAWAGLPDDRVRELRCRLDPQRAGTAPAGDSTQPQAS
jgi:hypothetical protein